MTFAARTLGYLSSGGIGSFAPVAYMGGTATKGLMYGLTVSPSGLFVAVGEGDLHIANSSYSTDGYNWSTPVLMTGTSGLGDTAATAVAISTGGATSGKWIAVGQSSTSGSFFATSNDGISWTSAGAFGSGGAAVDLAVNSSGTFVAISNSGFSYSTNGTTWSTYTAFTGSVTITAISTDTYGTGFIAVGYESSGGAPVYTTSSNGTSWTTPVRMNASSTTAYLQGITVDTATNRYVAVGYDSSNAAIYSYTTSAGSIWQTPARMNSSSTRANIRDVTYSSVAGLYIAVGDNILTGEALYATSSTGVTWTTPTTMGTTGLNIGASIAMYRVIANSSGFFSATGYGASSKAAYSYAVFP